MVCFGIRETRRERRLVYVLCKEKSKGRKHYLMKVIWSNCPKIHTVVVKRKK